MTISIGTKNPVKARLILEALSSKPRLNIIKLLLKKDRLSASEIAAETKTSLSTILEHLDLLQAAGLIKSTLEKRGRRRVKTYSIGTKIIELKIDLNTLTEVIDINELRELLKNYIDRKLVGKGLPLKISVRDIVDTLQLENLKKAIALIDLYNYDEEYIIDILIENFKRKEFGESIDIKELAKKLNIHEYWALRLAHKLSEKKEYTLEGNTLYKIKLSE